MHQAQAKQRRMVAARRIRKAVLQVESLEYRDLPALAWPTSLQPVADSAPHEVLDQALRLPVPWSAGAPATAQTAVAGNIGAGPNGAADVVWYHFTLDRSAHVTLGTFSGQQGTVLSLYNTDATDGSDPYDPLGHRLLVQADQAASGDQDAAPIERDLAAGDYYVAVSGAGNRYFNPFIAGSGYAGATGAYKLLVSATDLQIAPTDLPRVLAIDAAPDPVGAAAGTSFDRSPLLIRVDLSGPVDPTNLNVQVIGATGATNMVAGLAFSSVANEVRVSLTGPLAPDTYQVLVSATDSTGNQVLAANAAATFQITGIEGTNGAVAGDGTPATAHALDISGGGLVQVAGTIGDNPTDNFPFNPNDVDVYHFQFTGAGNYSLTAEAFAGRIGSPLNPGLSLFEVVGGNLHLVGVNVGTNNPQSASAASPITNPLQSDAALFAGLQAGDYYLAVSANGNTPDPFGADFPFDPSTPLGPTFGGFAFQGGNYVLNVQVQHDMTPPQVVAVTGLGPQALPAPPGQFLVRFSEAVNLVQQAFATQQNTLGSVFIVASNGTTYNPTLASYDGATNTATFLMQNGLAPGAYTLHLSGSDPTTAITDIAGNPLVGNDTSGATADFVQAFTVAGTGNGTSYQESANDELHPQDLGVLATFNLAAGITLTGQFAADGADFYHLQVLQAGQYIVGLQDTDAGASLPNGTWLSFENTNTGQTVPLALLGSIIDPVSQVSTSGNIAALVTLQPGTDYVIRADAWSAVAHYNLQLASSFTGESPPPLTVGAAPAIRLRLVNNGGPNPPPVVPPPPTSPPSANPPTGGAVTHAPSSSAVPGSVLLALTAGPIGDGTSNAGNQGPAAPDVFEQVFAHAPSPGLSDGIVRLAILSLQTGSPGESDNPSPDMAPATNPPPPAGETPPPTILQNLLNLWNSLPLGPILSPGTAAAADDASLMDDSADIDDSRLYDTIRPLPAQDADTLVASGAPTAAARFAPLSTSRTTSNGLERILAISLFFSNWARGLETQPRRRLSEGHGKRRFTARCFEGIN